MKESKYNKTKHMVMLSLFVAIIIIQTVVPFLGFIPLGIINATIIHITVIIATLLLGLKSGIFLGLIFDISSIIKNTYNPTLLSFCFSPFLPYGNMKSLIVSIFPRIMIAVLSFYSYKLLERYVKPYIAYAVAGIVGSLTNTLFVMSFIYIFFANEYAAVKNIALSSVSNAVISIVASNGVAEAIVSAVITAALMGVMRKIYKA